jgi:hypothetical protein
MTDTEEEKEGRREGEIAVCVVLLLLSPTQGVLMII